MPRLLDLLDRMAGPFLLGSLIFAAFWLGTHIIPARLSRSYPRLMALQPPRMVREGILLVFQVVGYLGLFLSVLMPGTLLLGWLEYLLTGKTTGAYSEAPVLSLSILVGATYEFFRSAGSSVLLSKLFAALSYVAAGITLISTYASAYQTLKRYFKARSEETQGH